MLQVYIVARFMHLEAIKVVPYGTYCMFFAVHMLQMTLLLLLLQLPLFTLYAVNLRAKANKRVSERRSNECANECDSNIFEVMIMMVIMMMMVMIMLVMMLKCC